MALRLNADKKARPEDFQRAVSLGGGPTAYWFNLVGDEAVREGPAGEKEKEKVLRIPYVLTRLTAPDVMKESGSKPVSDSEFFLDAHRKVRLLAERNADFAVREGRPKEALDRIAFPVLLAVSVESHRDFDWYGKNLEEAFRWYFAQKRRLAAREGAPEK